MLQRGKAGSWPVAPCLLINAAEEGAACFRLTPWQASAFCAGLQGVLGRRPRRAAQI